MDGLKVSQLARRAGVPATTLRFYEQQGLLTTRRSSSGYRLFDDEAVDRLRFIATAKSLGLSLHDIRALLRPWQHEGCREVQRALAPMLEQRGAEARERISGLREFMRRLDEARRTLERIDRDGPCDASCTFLTRSPVAMTCSLPVPNLRDRRARWSAMLVHTTSRRRRGDRVRVEFDATVLADGGAGELAALVRAEHECCPALDLSLTVGAEITVDAHVPDDDALDVALSLFGPLERG